MAAMTTSLTSRRRASRPGAEIDAVEDELAEAVAAAVNSYRAGQPTTAELEAIDRITKRRKTLYSRHTKVFA